MSKVAVTAVTGGGAQRTPMDTAPASATPIHFQLSLPGPLAATVAEAVRDGMQRAISVLMAKGEMGKIERALLHDADKTASLVVDSIRPNVALIEERIARMNSIKKILEEEEWLTAEQINQLQANPPKQLAHPASDWKRRARVYSVSHGGKEYFARYQFDAVYQPLAVIKDVLAAFGEAADPWEIASWFHFPNGWIAAEHGDGGEAVAPKEALDRRADVLHAVACRKGSYVA